MVSDDGEVTQLMEQGNNGNLLSQESEEYNLVSGYDGHIPREGHRQCIPKTQLNVHNGNNESTYLAMLTSVRLDNPTKSFESRNNINQGGNHKTRRFRVVNLLRHG